MSPRTGVWVTCIALLASGCLIGETVTDLDEFGEGELEDGEDAEPSANDSTPHGPPEGEPEDADEHEDEDAGGVFVPDEDPIPIEVCDPLDPDACEAGEKCNIFRLDSEFTSQCVPIADATVARGEQCSPIEDLGPGADNCEAGTVCWDVMNGRGTCLSFCDIEGDAGDQCGADFICNWGKSFPGSAGLCTPTCSPMGDDCPETCGCYWEGTDFLCLPVSSNLETGEPCGFLNDCEQGNYCANSELLPDCEGPACCAEFCDLAAPVCGEGLACTAFFEEEYAPEGHEDLGVCLMPGA